jgi:methylated-DNA-[protein]-cysteine S-methyltransferase
MPTIYHKTPLGVARITEEDGFISEISVLDEFEYPREEAPTPVLKMAALELDEYFAGGRRVFNMPLKQHGSDFQQLVWDELSKISYGETISYGQQSLRMNNPLAIRAIASANGKNNIWLVVPCHRVIGSDGSLTGYASGVWRKQWLLDHEAKVAGIGQTKLEF